MTWLGFAGIFFLFFVTHSVPVRPTIKARIIARLGAAGFGIGYSVLSIAMLALLIWATGEAPFVEVWPQMNWHRHAAHLCMLAACLTLALSIARPNPFSFGGMHAERFDPERAGIIRYVRHPILFALALWAGAHMLPNGDLAHLLLFGVLGAFAIMGRRLINRRKQREFGMERWAAINSAVARAPLLHAPTSWGGTVFRVGLGIAAFASLLVLHPIVIGVSVL